MSYYKSYFLHPSNKIKSLEDLGFGIRVFNCEYLNIKIMESYSNLSTINIVYYCNTSFNQKIQKYHTNKYPNAILAICEESDFRVKITFYENYKETRYFIETFLDNGKPKIRQEFNADFELEEYSEVFYKDGKLDYEKYFLPDSWTIHKED